jgi:hypothetical protein
MQERVHETKYGFMVALFSPQVSADFLARHDEEDLDDTTVVPQIRKLFAVLAEGPSVQWSRGDKTPLELFLAVVSGWEAGLRQWLW